MREALAESGVGFELKTTKLPASRLGESNSVLINGKDIETLVNKRKGSRYTACRGCSTLISGPCDCRAYTHRGKKYTHVPKAMIRMAIKEILGPGRRK